MCSPGLEIPASVRVQSAVGTVTGHAGEMHTHKDVCGHTGPVLVVAGMRSECMARPPLTRHTCFCPGRCWGDWR